MGTTILLGTVAIEPNRWGLAREGGDPVIALSDWTEPIGDAGFDGLELWEKHVTATTEAEADAVLDGPIPVTVLNTYAPLEADDAARRSAADWARRAGVGAMKFNTGTDPEQAELYGERIADWLELLPDATRLICECHWGTVAEDPAVAGQILSAAGPPERVQALVHLGDQPDDLRAKFDAHGDRITHVHVNFLDGLEAPLLRDIRDTVESRVGLLDSLGFDGTWTIEFTHGVGTDNDNPGETLESAIADLAVLRALML